MTNRAFDCKIVFGRLSRQPVGSKEARHADKTEIPYPSGTGGWDLRRLHFDAVFGSHALPVFKGKRAPPCARIAGMVAAWELRKAGYLCTVLEARERAGRRNWTLRKGTRVVMFDGTTQTCNFADDLYFNAGPARLPPAAATSFCHVGAGCRKASFTRGRRRSRPPFRQVALEPCLRSLRPRTLVVGQFSSRSGEFTSPIGGIKPPLHPN